MDVEWAVLEAIHPAICIHRDGPSATLRVPVELPRDTPLRVSHAPAGPAPDPDPDPDPDAHATLAVLPPVLLRVLLPPAYPARAPPLVLSLHATPPWLPPPICSLLRDRLLAMWAPGDDAGILYTWVEWIRTGDFLADVGLLVGDTIVIPHPSPRTLLAALNAHAASQKSAEFATTSFSCAICLSERKGVHCVALSCGHVFCRACLVDMWGLHVTEGQLSYVSCPERGCEHDGADAFREATEDEVRDILSDDQLERWKRLRRNRDLERDPTILYCPMEHCQEPVPKPKSHVGTDDDVSSWAGLRTCGACGYSFCAFCRHTWHGPHTSCPLPLTSKFVLEYISAPRLSPKRQAIEQRYGRSNVLKLVRQYDEEQQNKKWIESSTMSCPGCAVKVEKSMGCNHMSCIKCKTHFCYLCGSKLRKTDPYEHFSAPNSPCFTKLFDLVRAVDEWQPVEAFDPIE